MFNLLTNSILVNAQDQNIQALLLDSVFIVRLLVAIFFVLALLFFLWGLAKFILAAGDESKIQEGKRIMFWGIIALFIIASLFGIVTFITEAFNLEGNAGAGPRLRLP